MRDTAKENPDKALRRKVFLEKGYELFTAKNIDSVSLQDVANAAGYGIATLYRYFVNKPNLVIEIAAWKWSETITENQKRRPIKNFDGMTAADIFEFYIDSFLELYRNHRDLLRFNQFFNIYIRAEHINPDILKPYQAVIEVIGAEFHNMYIKAEQDKTIRTDISEKEMFSTTLHLMLAVVTRYAVGLVYKPESWFNAENELNIMKEMIILKYKGENSK